MSPAYSVSVVDELVAVECLEQELAILLRKARSVSAEMAQEIHPDLEPYAYGLLTRIDQEGAARAADLVIYLGVGKSTISRQLRDLEDLGLIERAPDPQDGRAAVLRLTDRGRTRFCAARDGRRSAFRSALEVWPEKDIAELARLLGALNASF